MGRLRPSDFNPIMAKRWKRAVPGFRLQWTSVCWNCSQVPGVAEAVGSAELPHRLGCFPGVETSLGSEGVAGSAPRGCNHGSLQLEGNCHFLKSGMVYQPVQNMWTGNRHLADELLWTPSSNYTWPYLSIEQEFGFLSPFPYVCSMIKLMAGCSVLNVSSNPRS